jgi:hypothetical protein
MIRPTDASRVDSVVRNGIATLGPESTRLLAQLDEVFLGWARRAGAMPMTVAPLIDVADLAAFHVFRNFPQLTWVAAPILPAGAGDITGEVPTGTMGPAQLGLPTAVCYSLYPYFRDQTVTEPTLVTAAGMCFRNEILGEPGLRRLRAFRMREIVVLGTPDQVRDRLQTLGALVLRFARELDIPVSREVATDPFFSPAGPAAHWQRLRPGKHEIRCDGLALASINEHRKFFGAACRITGAQSGGIVSTGCVGMGLERWIDTIGQRYGGKFDTMSGAVAAAAARMHDDQGAELS